MKNQKNNVKNKQIKISKNLGVDKNNDEFPIEEPIVGIESFITTKTVKPSPYDSKVKFEK